jgi:hypothetical protein
LFVYILNNMFLISWKNSKSLPDGIIYEGVSTKPLKVCIILHINSGEFAGMSADIRIGGNDTSLWERFQRNLEVTESCNGPRNALRHVT